MLRVDNGFTSYLHIKEDYDVYYYYIIYYYTKCKAFHEFIVIGSVPFRKDVQ